MFWYGIQKDNQDWLGVPGGYPGLKHGSIPFCSFLWQAKFNSDYGLKLYYPISLFQPFEGTDISCGITFFLAYPIPQPYRKPASFIISFGESIIQPVSKFITLSDRITQSEFFTEPQFFAQSLPRNPYPGSYPDTGIPHRFTFSDSFLDTYKKYIYSSGDVYDSAGRDATMVG